MQIRDCNNYNIYTVYGMNVERCIDGEGSHIIDTVTIVNIRDKCDQFNKIERESCRVQCKYENVLYNVCLFSSFTASPSCL